MSEHDIAPTSAVEFLPPDQLDMIGEPETLVLLRCGYRVLVLAYENDACRFLDSQGCSIHEARPSACRSYPFDRSDDERRPLDLVPSLMCPEETGYLVTLNKEPRTSQSFAFTSTVRMRDRQLSRYAELVQSWNQRQRSRLKLRKIPQQDQRFIEFLLRSTGPSA